MSPPWATSKSSMPLFSRCRTTPCLASLILFGVLFLSWVALEAPGVPEKLQRFKPSAQLGQLTSHSSESSQSSEPSKPLPSLPPLLEDEKTDAFRSLIRSLYKPTQSLNATTFHDYAGTEWKNEGESLWTQPLGEKLCIVDIDTRPLDKSGEIMDKDPLNWDKTNELAAGMLNHYMYAQVHGYKYYFIRTEPLKDRAPYWTKPSALSRILEAHDICIAIDADAVFTHLSLPFEWLLSRWGFVPGKTSIGMALDPDKPFNRDSFGRRVTNAGFVVAQNLPRTHDMLAAWSSCPDDTERFPDCAKWKKPWPAEQRAFADYIRYEFDGEHDVKEIPCTEGNGYPQSETECMGQFIRHFWIKKQTLLKPGVSASLAQAMLGLAHDDLIGKKNEVVFKDKVDTGKKAGGG